MKKWPFVALLLLGSTILGATVLREPIALAAQGVDATIIGPLDGQGNVKVHEQGTAAVIVRGTPDVRVAREPFQQFVGGNVGSSGEDCDLIEVPAGKRLTIESFSAEVTSSASPPADVYLRVFVDGNPTQSFVRSVQLRLTHAFGPFYAGDVQTLLFDGEANDPAGATYGYAACVGHGDGSFRGFVSGYLEPEA
jgi:hypothetical protein